MKKMKNGMSGIIICLFEIVVGILLLINPIGFTTGIIMSAGIVLMLSGIIFVIKYFRADIARAASGQYLAKGIAALVGGAFCTFNSSWFVVTFPALTIIYGVVVLLIGIGKVQNTVDMIRRKNKKWFISGIAALISLVCGGVILGSPFTTTAVLWMFTGISMIVESVVDIIALIFSASTKEKKKEKEIQDA